MNSRTTTIAFITGIVLLTVLLLLAKHKPTVEIADLQKIDLDRKVDSAVALVNSGENPMQGIFILRSVLEEDSNHIGAIMQLGVFSIQSGQYEKALARFDKVLGLDESVADAYFYKGLALGGLNRRDEAIEILEEYLTMVDDEVAVREVNKYINELKTK